MNKLFLGGVTSLLFFLSACAVETKVLQARTALLYGDPDVALASFQSAAESDPGYLYFSVFPQGIWTYVGRAYYIAGKYPEARHALERAISLHKEDNMAKLYLGLNLARSGDRQSGLKEIEGGLRGLHEWLDYVNQYAALSYVPYWELSILFLMIRRPTISTLSRKDIDWQK